MPNWLADPTECAKPDRKGACVILLGRNEVLSRSTRVYRETVGADTIWSSGNVAVRRMGEDARLNHGKANLRLTVTQPVSSRSKNVIDATLPPLLPAEAILASDVLRAAAVNSGGNACGGETLLEVMWEELMVIMDRLMTGQEAEDGKDPGRAEGVAYAIAVMQNPYLPNLDNVREQAMARWEEENSE